MLETAIRTALLDVGEITDLVAQRIRPLIVGQSDVLPYLTYQVTGRTLDNTLAHGPSSYRKAEFEIGIFGATYAVVADLSELVRTRFEAFSQTLEGVELDTLASDETDVEEVIPEGTETPVYLRVMTFSALYRLVS